MNIVINNENIITNSQINRILRLTRFEELENLELAVLERKLDILKGKRLLHFLAFIRTFHCEGAYKDRKDFIIIKLYNLENNIESRKLYGIGVLLHELKHREDVMSNKETTEESADRYAINFLNNNSSLLRNILNLSNTWEVKEF